MRANLFLVGGQKCGTTTLADLLDRHPKVCLARPKEPGFFNRSSWRSRIEEYHHLFDHKSGGETVFLDASTMYTFHPHTNDYSKETNPLLQFARIAGSRLISNKRKKSWENFPHELHNQKVWECIHEYNPEAKILYLLRNPLERVRSAYVHLKSRGFIDGSLQETLKDDPFILDVCRYASQIGPYIETFGRQNVMILDFEELKREQAETFSKVCEFVGLEVAAGHDHERVHSNSGESVREHFLVDQLRRLPIGDFVPDGLKRSINKSGLLQGRPSERIPPLQGDIAHSILDELEEEISGIERLTGKSFASWRKVPD